MTDEHWHVQNSEGSRSMTIGPRQTSDRGFPSRGFSRAYGTNSSNCSPPAAEAAGYYQRSLTGPLLNAMEYCSDLQEKENSGFAGNRYHRSIRTFYTHCAVG